jgi:hypothetical protein
MYKREHAIGFFSKVRKYTDFVLLLAHIDLVCLDTGNCLF